MSSHVFDRDILGHDASWKETVHQRSLLVRCPHQYLDAIISVDTEPGTHRLAGAVTMPDSSNVTSHDCA